MAEIFGRRYVPVTRCSRVHPRGRWERTATLEVAAVYFCLLWRALKRFAPRIGVARLA
jgi:hypothetical protein